MSRFPGAPNSEWQDESPTDEDEDDTPPDESDSMQESDPTVSGEQAQQTVTQKVKEEQRGVEWRKTAATVGGVAVLLSLFYARTVLEKNVGIETVGMMLAVAGTLLSFGTGRDILAGDSLLPGK